MRKFMILAIFMAAINVRGQSITPEVMASSGTSFSAGKQILDWTMGEFSIQSYTHDGTTSNNPMLTEGFHQPHYVLESGERENISGMENLEVLFNVYPNPVNEKLFIELDGPQETFILEITDITGSLVHKDEFTDNKHEVEMQSYNAGLYLVKIYNQKQVFKIIKITKSN